VYPVTNYYLTSEKFTREQVSRGQLWWAYPLYVFGSPKITRFWSNRPTETINLQQFDASKELADEEAQTQPGEFLGVFKSKMRPVLVLSNPSTTYSDRAWRGGEYFLVAPIRSLRNEYTNEYKSDHNFVWNTITYQYSSLFYLPAGGEYEIKESVLHFDHITTLHRSWFLKPRKVKMTNEAMICVDAWLRNYIYGKVPKGFYDQLKIYQEQMGDAPQVRSSLFR
jgi:hypothetical protein